MMNISESSRGRLSAMDLSDIPFNIKRAFIVDKVGINCVRSDHAHVKDNQLLYCLNGSLKIKLTPTNLITTRQTLKIKDYILIPKLTWSVITFLDPNSSFICFCSEKHDESEYIRDYNVFVQKFSNQT